jgi:hypothetical protein
MTSELYLVIGLIIGAFSVPSILGAFSQGRVPRTAAIMVMISGGLIALAIHEKPGGYEIADIPQAFVNVVARYMP